MHKGPCPRKRNSAKCHVGTSAAQTLRKLHCQRAAVQQAVRLSLHILAVTGRPASARKHTLLCSYCCMLVYSSNGPMVYASWALMWLLCQLLPCLSWWSVPFSAAVTTLAVVPRCLSHSSVQLDQRLCISVPCLQVLRCSKRYAVSAWQQGHVAAAAPAATLQHWQCSCANLFSKPYNSCCGVLAGDCSSLQQLNTAAVVASSYGSGSSCCLLLLVACRAIGACPTVVYSWNLHAAGAVAAAAAKPGRVNGIWLACV